MSIDSASQASIEMGSVKPFRAIRWGRFVAPLVVGTALAAAYMLYGALRPPGEVIRRDLLAAGSELEGLPWSAPSSRVQDSIARHFPAAYAPTVDGSRFPAAVTVTLHNVARAACLDARRAASRIDGPVVIAIDDWEPTPKPCSDNAVLTWLLLP
jgi:hypothetical protein